MYELMKSSSNALDPTLGFIQYLEHLVFLEYLLVATQVHGMFKQVLNVPATEIASGS